MAQTAWDKQCENVAKDDGLPTREVGAWSEDKLYFWHRYVQITTTAMVGKPAWTGGVVYLDLFAGPGVCTVKETKKRLPGSPLIAAYAPKPFSRIIACELDAALASACEERLKQTPAASACCVVPGDCNLKIDEALRQIPNRALTLAFIDPESLHIQFETVRKVAARGAVDLLVLFADAFDVLRNVDKYYVPDPNSKLDLFLGRDSDWRKDWAALGDQSAAKARDLFYAVYKRQLGKLGYKRFGEQRISGPSGPLYRLVYASKDDRGLDFWEKAKKRERGGQDMLF